jgi:hypothetical protein
MKRFLLPFASVLFVVSAFSVSALGETIHDLRAWASVTGQGPLRQHSPWRWYFDVQNRDRNTAHDIDQFVVRPAVGYTLNDRSSAWLGYAYTANFTSRGRVYEHRSWEQFVYTLPQRVPLTLRFRIEQRFFAGSRTGWRYRQQARVIHPFASKPSLSGIAWEEVLFNLNATSRSKRGLDQNRAFAGLGFKLHSKIRLDLGYLNQFVHTAPANRMNHALSAVVNLNF